MRHIIHVIRTATAASLLVAAPLVAQSSSPANKNISDHSSAGISAGALGGFFSPGFPAVGHMSPNSITVLRGLADGTFMSSISGARVPAAEGAQVMALLRSGTVESLNAVQNSLNAAGGPTTEVAALMAQLVSLTNRDGISGDVEKAQLLNAVAAYNTMIAAASPQFIASMPPMLLAVHGALLTVGVNRSFSDR